MSLSSSEIYFFFCPSTNSTFPSSQALTLLRILLPIDICQSYSYLHTHTASFIYQCTGAYVQHQSRSKYIYIEIPTSIILCPKRFKNNAKSFKFILLTTPMTWLDLQVSKLLYQRICNPRFSLRVSSKSYPCTLLIQEWD